MYQKGAELFNWGRGNAGKKFQSINLTEYGQQIVFRSMLGCFRVYFRLIPRCEEWQACLDLNPTKKSRNFIGLDIFFIEIRWKRYENYKKSVHPNWILVWRNGMLCVELGQTFHLSVQFFSAPRLEFFFVYFETKPESGISLCYLFIGDGRNLLESKKWPCMHDAQHIYIVLHAACWLQCCIAILRNSVRFFGWRYR